MSSSARTHTPRAQTTLDGISGSSVSISRTSGSKVGGVTWYSPFLLGDFVCRVVVVVIVGDTQGIDLANGDFGFVADNAVHVDTAVDVDVGVNVNPDDRNVDPVATKQSE